MKTKLLTRHPDSRHSRASAAPQIRLGYGTVQARNGALHGRVTATPPARQGGSVLLEALISILIFSFGILGIVGLQAAMISGAAEAKYRNEAGFFANRLLGEMAAANRSTVADLAPFVGSGGSGGANYSAWYAGFQNTDTTLGLLGLPGATTNPPTVAVALPANQPLNTSGQPTRYDVAITVFWQAPGQPVHRHVVNASISAD